MEIVNNKILTAIVFTFFIGFNSFGQKLSLTDLQNICNKKNWEYVNQFLMNKGWEYSGSEKGDSEKYSTITWSLNKSYEDKAEGWFYLYTFENSPNKISYSVFNKPAYTIIQNSLSSNSYKLTNNEIEDNKIISTYSNSKFILKITTENREKENSYEKSITAYDFLLIKKSSIYDPDNGKKTTYYYGDVKEAEYTLLNGEIEGKLKIYNENGTLKKEGNYINGKKDGKFIEYDELGNKEAEYYMKNDLKNGLLIFYKDNKISNSISYIDDIKNGDFVKYFYGDESGELFLKEKGKYLNDEKNGKWGYYVVEDEKERVLTYSNYKNNIKEGIFQEAKNDSLIIGSYKNNKLSGQYNVYIDIMRMALGGIIKTDPTELNLISQGEYYEGNRSGLWKFFDLLGSITKEGSYSNGEKVGEWKYYYRSYSKSNGEEVPYSKELYLVENYSNGKLNGKLTRFSYLDTDEYPCVEKDESRNPLDTCKRYTYHKEFSTFFYKNGQLNGPHELKDSTNQIITKGKFINNQKEGEWFYRYNLVDNTISYEEGKYANNQRDGKWIQYFEKGKINFTFNYNKGKLDGEYIEWNDNNKVRSKKLFKDGDLYEIIIYDDLGINPTDKYEIYDKNSNGYTCRKTKYILEKRISQEYWLSKNIKIDPFWFVNEFLEKINSQDSKNEVFKNGVYEEIDSNGKTLHSGFYYKEDKVGKWGFYSYEQGVIVNSTYILNDITKEEYFTLNGVLFSGEYIKIMNIDSIKEIIKVKDGLRNGRTEYVDIKTGKTIKKESYKKGVLK